MEDYYTTSSHCINYTFLFNQLLSLLSSSEKRTKKTRRTCPSLRRRRPHCLQFVRSKWSHRRSPFTTTSPPLWMIWPSRWASEQTTLPTRAKLQNQNLHRRVAKRYRQVDPACKKPFKLSEYDRVAHNNSKTTWRELAEVTKRWKTWLELGAWSNSSQSNSSQLKPIGWPNDTQLHRSCELGSSWVDRLARA